MAASDIRNYLRAGYPCLFLRTIEPDYAENLVREEANEVDELKERGRFGVWKIVGGFKINDVKNTKDAEAKSGNDFGEAVKLVMEAHVNSPLVAVFHNVRQLINIPSVIQRLLDAIQAARLSGSVIVFIGPELDPPVELHHLIKFVDISLPSKNDLESLFSNILEAYKDEKEWKALLSIPKNKDEQKQVISLAATAALGLDSVSAENAFTYSIAKYHEINLPSIQRQKSEEIKKSDVLEFFETVDTLDDIGGFDNFKTWLVKRKNAFTQKARDYHLPFPKGFLLVGPAGSGKSLAAKIASNVLQLPLVRFDVGKIFRSLVGDSEAATRLALKTAEAVAPVILLLDEVEKGFAGVNNSGTLDSGVTARVISTILTWKQETKAAVLFAMTANNVAGLPSMIYRKGRLDEVWSTDLPLDFEREEIFRIHIRKVFRNPDEFDLQSLAAASDGFTGAEIEGCIGDALYTAFDLDQNLSTQFVLRALKETVPQSKRSQEEVDAIREWAKTRARSVSSGKKVARAGSPVRKLHLTKKN